MIKLFIWILTANLFINFTINRVVEIFGLIVFAGILLLISLITYSPEDPNFIFPDNTKIKNLLGFHGSFISDLFLQSLGLISYLLSITFIVTGINIFRSKEFFNYRKYILLNNFLFFCLIFTIVFLIRLFHFIY